MSITDQSQAIAATVPEKTRSYAENYEKLKSVIGRLTGNQAPEIDELPDLVAAGGAALLACRERLDQVDAAVREKIAGLGLNAPGAG